MNKKLQNYYSQTEENKIWNRICSRIDSENNSDISDDEPDIFGSQPPKRKISVTRSLSAAAAVIVIAAAGIYGVSYNTSESDVSSDNYDNAESATELPENSADASDHSLFFPASDGWDFSTVAPSAAKSHSYSDYEDTVYYPFENNYSDDFFVESDVLSDTDFFLDCRIESMEYDAASQTVTYTVSPIHAVASHDITLSPETRITSTAAYVLTAGHEYLLPVHIGDSGEYRTADSSSPKIEFTDERYIIYHNGWTSLDNDGQYLFCTDRSPDDFFYDRMNIAPESSLSDLFSAYLNK